MYKFYRGFLPENFDTFFTKNSEVHDHDTRQAKCLHLPMFHTELGKRSFKYKSVIIWNQLLEIMPSFVVSISTFKSHLKNYLISHELIHS